MIGGQPPNERTILLRNILLGANGNKKREGGICKAYCSK